MMTDSATTGGLTDEFPQVHLGDWILAIDVMPDPRGDDLAPAAEPGDLGHVIGKQGRGCAVTVRWERTGLAVDALPGYDFEVLAAADFAATPETTPRKPRRDFLRRGKS